MAKYYDLNIPGSEVQRRLDLASHNVLAFDGILDVPVTASDELITAAESYQILYAPNGGRGEMLMSIGGTYYRNFRLQSSGKTHLDSSWYNEDGQIRKDRLFLNGAARDIYAYAAGSFGKVERDGVDGITPHIDPTTKHWMLGNEDTGIVAEGKDGEDGVDGKSAYQTWLETDGLAAQNKTEHGFLVWLQDRADNYQGPFYSDTVSGVTQEGKVYYVPGPDSDKYRVMIFYGGESHVLATRSGMLSNYTSVYDISASNENTPYSTLQQALAAITDDSVKKGGMAIKFIQGTGNDAKYVQYRLIRTTFPSTYNESDWEESNATPDVDLSAITDEYTSYNAFTTGKYIDVNGSEQGAWNYCCTPYIEAMQGDEFTFTASAINVSEHPVILGYNSDKSFNRILSTDVGTDKKLIVPEGISFIRFSALKDSDHEIKRLNKQSIPVIRDNIEEVLSQVDGISEKLVEETNDNLTEGYEDNDNKYINNKGNVTDLNGWAFKEFSVKKGEVINIRTYPKDNIAILSKKNNDTSYNVLIPGAYQSGVTAGDYSYTANENMTVAVCFRVATTDRYYKSTYDKMSAIEDNIEELDSKVGNVDTAIDEKIEDLGISEIETDNLTEEISNGYVRNDGVLITNNADYSVKCFPVKAGTHIEFTAYLATNVAPIAKKLANQYTVLVSHPGSSNPITVIYDVTEDMDVCLSFQNADTKPRSVKFTTNKIGLIELLSHQIDVLKDKLFNQDIGIGYLFDKIAVIGDSLSVGTLDAVSGDSYAHAAGGSFGCSWLTCLAKRWGSTVRMHYARGGATCYTWLSHETTEEYMYGIELMLRDPVQYDAYFIALGHNDTNKYGSVGTTSDEPIALTIDGNNNVGSLPSMSDVTFLSLYKTIVNAVRNKAPNALIFCMTTYDKDNVQANTIGAQNQYIRQIAQWYRDQGDERVFLIDYATKTDITRSTTGYGNGTHFSTFGYAYVAMVINSCINETILEHLNTNALKIWGNYLENKRTTRVNTTVSGGYVEHL